MVNYLQKKDDSSVVQIGGGSGAIDDGAITNAKVASDAAIAGSKISPDFGSQNIVTSGDFLHGVSSSENTTGNSGTKLITAGDLQIDGDQKNFII